MPAAYRAAGELLELVMIDALPADAGETRLEAEELRLVLAAGIPARSLARSLSSSGSGGEKNCSAGSYWTHTAAFSSRARKMCSLTADAIASAPLVTLVE